MKGIVITDQDLRQDGENKHAAGVKVHLPVWWVAILGVLAFLPPLLVLAVVISLVLQKNKPMEFRYRGARACIIALIASWLLWMTAGGMLLRKGTDFKMPSVGLSDSIRFDKKISSYAGDMTAKDIARSRMPLVVVVHAVDGLHGGADGIGHEPAGAGVIVAALEQGCLILTSRHVVESVCRRAELNALVGISLEDGQKAAASVVGVHQNLDMALLWVKREDADTECMQDIRSYDSIDVGEVVYALGHPGGLQFTISSGLISQKRGVDVLQFSAPVSPGNSGGPIYDASGRLMALVQAVYDKAKNPNAENLNFGERVDDLHDQYKWVLTEKGRHALTGWARIKQDNQAGVINEDEKER